MPTRYRLLSMCPGLTYDRVEVDSETRLERHRSETSLASNDTLPLRAVTYSFPDLTQTGEMDESSGESGGESHRHCGLRIWAPRHYADQRRSEARVG